jgi:hypothetical protein
MHPATRLQRTTRRGFATVVVASLTVGAVLATTGVAAARADSAKVPTACALFTPEIAATALGGPVNPPEAKKPSAKITVCKYVRADGQGFGTVEVGPWSFVHILGKSTKIKGIGDQAQGSPAEGVSVRRGANGFHVNLALQVGSFDGQQATDLEAAQLAAATAAAKQMAASFGKKR